MKLAILDTYYPDVIEAVHQADPELKKKSYKDIHAAFMAKAFGTSNFVSSAFEQIGHSAEDFLVNDPRLQARWGRDNDVSGNLLAVAMAQIKKSDPDVVFMQNLSFFPPNYLRDLKQNYVLAGQCSCPWPGDDYVRHFDVIFTSFPHYVDRINQLPPRAKFLPLAFAPQILERIKVKGDPFRDVTFVGGFGRHWEEGPKVFEHLAEKVPQFRWWGYADESINQYPALKQAHQGEAWGLDMYQIYANSKIVVNRHGEVAEGYSNNLRIYEAAGMGAVLVTEYASNLRDILMPEVECCDYTSAEDLVGKVTALLNYPTTRKKTAVLGQKKVLDFHTYKHRAVAMAGVFEDILENKR